MMSDWEANDYLNELRKMRSGDESIISDLFKQSPLSAINEDGSCFLIVRRFKVQESENGRRVLNREPDDEHYQFGITIVRVGSDDSGSQRNVKVQMNI